MGACSCGENGCQFACVCVCVCPCVRVSVRANWINKCGSLVRKTPLSPCFWYEPDPLTTSDGVSAPQNRQVTLTHVFTRTCSLELIYHMHVAQIARLPRRHGSPSSCFVFSAAFIRLTQRWRWNARLCFWVQSLGRRITIKQRSLIFIGVKLLFIDSKITLFPLFLPTACSQLMNNLTMRTSRNQIKTYCCKALW